MNVTRNISIPGYSTELSPQYVSAMKRGHLPINRNRLEAELVRQQLKVWWVAEQIKVDRKTISRWLAGTVEAASLDNIEALAQLLQRPFEELCQSDQNPSPAAQPEVSTTAQLIVDKGLKDILEVFHNHALLEAILKGSLHPQLDPNTHATLRLDLAHALMRQDRFVEAEEKASRSLELLRAMPDSQLQARAHMTKGNLTSIMGRPEEARDSYQLAEELARLGGATLILAKTLANHGNTLLLMGETAEAFPSSALGR